MTKKIIITFFTLLFPIISLAQEIKGNVANLEDPRLLFISSAATALQHTAQIVAGYERYYSGLGGNGLQNGFVAFSFPYHRLGAFSWNGQYFTSDIYRTGNFSFGYGHVFMNNKFSLGFDLGMIFLSYNQDNFKLVDLNDPVFSNGPSKSALDLGVSLFANPIDPLYIGIAVKHVTQSNISLVGDDVRKPIKFQNGVMFRNSIASPLISF